METTPFLSPPPLHNHSNNDNEITTFLSQPSTEPKPQEKADLWRKKNSLHRCQTAPALTIMQQNQKFPRHPQSKKPEFESNWLITKASLWLIFYLSLGITFYAFNTESFSGIDTNPIVDALYFCIVTMCTIGYGDITPQTALTKLFACAFVLVGFGFIDILLNGVVNYALDLQENMLLTRMQSGGGSVNAAKKYIVNIEKGRMRIRMKVVFALGVVISCIGTGIAVLYNVEGLSMVDSVYLSVMSVTTVGYGDRTFRTLKGRLFASVWLLLSTLAVARAFLYLVEARVDKRHRRAMNLVLHRDITPNDVIAADVDHHGYMSKSEYVISKLKEMGKISDKDVLQIYDQFNQLDKNNTGKITLHNLMASGHLITESDCSHEV